MNDIGRTIIPVETKTNNGDYLTFIEQLASEPMVISDDKYRILWSNFAFQQLFGYEQDKLRTLRIIDLFPEESQHIISSKIINESESIYEVNAISHNQHTFPVQVKGNTLTHQGETIRLTTVVDLTEHKKHQQEQERSYNELETFFTNSVFGVIMLRGGRKIYRANQRFADIFGYDNPTEVEGKQVIDFHLSEEKYLSFGEKYYELLIQRDMLQVEYQVKKKDGSAVWVSISGRAIDPESPPNLDYGVVWIFEDISTRKQMEEQLLQMATIDTLTQINNRRHFFDLAEKEYAKFKRHSTPLSVLILDIDYFKSINDNFGHQIGDKVLQQFAQRCKENLRTEDIFGRIGGEEFCAILPYTDRTQAINLANRIRIAVQNIHPTIQEELPPITVSIGVVEADKEKGLKEICGQADACLYTAKREGRNRVKSL